MKFKRIFLIVLDSVGIGNAKDASQFGDLGSNTLLNTINKTGIKLPNLEKLGMLNFIDKSNHQPYSYITRANEVSNGKDTLTGHLEMMGVITETPFKTFTETGFPSELLKELSLRSNRGIIGNISASGTEIIEKLGEEHMRTGSLIVYTSADSVLQIAAHEEIVPLDELYNICAIARELTLKEEFKVGRVIARPFIGSPGSFKRTSNRHDYALNPASKTVLDSLKEANYDVISVGKIADVFNNCGITLSIKTKDNMDGIRKIIETTNTDFNGLLFANLNDFDSLFGHRRDVVGYGNALVEFDRYLPNIIVNLKEHDLLIITADHGNDPTFKGTDHTRELIPVLAYSSVFSNPYPLPDLNSFSDIGATIADNFDVYSPNGESFLNKMRWVIVQVF